MKKTVAAYVIIIAVLLIPYVIRPQDKKIDFDSPDWTLVNGKIVEHLGRKALMGFAYLKDVQFQNGIIEVDIVVERKTSYPGVLFRMNDTRNYERFYIRPHRAGLYSDAIQYVASFNGVDSWQLYNGSGKTAPLEIPYGSWFHVKMEVKDSQVCIFINNSNVPSLVINELQHGISSGMIGLMGPVDGTAYYSNFSFRLDDNINMPPATKTVIPLGLITNWEISQVFKANEIDFENTPSMQGIKEIQWKKIESLPNGIVDISRYFSRMGADADCIFAKTEIECVKDEMKQFAFGYSDMISIFVNGKIIFSANSAYRQRDPSFLGIIGLNDYIYLPLKKGKNELLICIAELSGGWGFIFQDANANYLDKSITEVWEVPFKFKYPESIQYDTRRDILYVSNYFNNGNEFISKLNLNGEIQNLKWISGLKQPTGMCISNDKLFVVDRKNLHEINIDSNKIVNSFPIPNALFPNDVTADESGDLYLTDTQRNSILKFSNGVFTDFYQSDQIQNINGILYNEGKLILGVSGDASIKQIDLSDKTISTLAQIEPGSIMDGIKLDGNGNLLFSDYNGRVFRLSKDRTLTELINSKVPQKFCADFEFIKGKSLLVIPSLFDNRIRAYKIN
jgi:sugar lactone lactonase YvrE